MLRKVLLVLGPMSFAVAALFACEGDNGSGAGGVLDAGKLDVTTTPPFDGDSAAAVDGQVTPAAVSVTVSGTLLDGVNVIFHDANGLVLDKSQTGVDGKASSSAAGIAMVTALQARDTVRHAVTWTNVVPGDNLTLTELPSTAPAGTYTVTVPQLLGNREGYDVYSGACSSGIAPNAGTSPVVTLSSFRCIGASPTAILASALLATTGATNFLFTKTGSAAPFGGTNVAATLTGAWTAPSTTTLSVTNNTAAATLRTSVGEIANGLIFAPTLSQSITTETASFAYPAGFADALLAQVITGTGGSARQIATRYAAGPTVSFDYAQLLGTITGSTLDASNATRPVVTWGGDSTANTDGGLVTFAFAVPGDETNTYSWTFVVAPGATAITAPALPADASFAPLPDAGATSFGRAAVQFFEADVFGSPASFRQQQGVILGPDTGTTLRTAPALTANGTFRSTGYFQLR